MSIQTPLDLVTQALKRCGALGVGQTPLAEDTNDAFDALNGMIAQWNRKRWLVWGLDDVACVTTGAQSYTIGPGAQFDTPRPDRLEAAYVRLLPVQASQTFDTPLAIIESHEDYANLVMKNLSTYPLAIFYDTSPFPNSLLYPYPVPTEGRYEVHVLIKNQILPFRNLNESLPSIIPPEYFEALSWNLAARLRPAYQMQPDPQVVALAITSLNTLRQANTQVPVLSMPMGYPRNRGIANGYIAGVTGGMV